MKPVRINIGTASTSALRMECRRLELPMGLGEPTTSKGRLLAYNQKQKLWEKWTAVAEALFGKNHGIDTTNLDTVVDGVAGKLYDRLVEAGYVGLTDETPSLRDERNRLSFQILHRQGTGRNVEVRNKRDDGTTGAGSMAIVYAARCAFPDVAEAVPLDTTQKVDEVTS